MTSRGGGCSGWQGPTFEVKGASVAVQRPGGQCGHSPASGNQCLQPRAGARRTCPSARPGPTLLSTEPVSSLPRCIAGTPVRVRAWGRSSPTGVRAPSRELLRGPPLTPSPPTGSSAPPALPAHLSPAAPVCPPRALLPGQCRCRSLHVCAHSPTEGSWRSWCSQGPGAIHPPPCWLPGAPTCTCARAPPRPPSVPMGPAWAQGRWCLPMPPAGSSLPFAWETPPASARASGTRLPEAPWPAVEMLRRGLGQ